jgi:hypothetical protein
MNRFGSVGVVLALGAMFACVGCGGSTEVKKPETFAPLPSAAPGGAPAGGAGNKPNTKMEKPVESAS